jgi:hypothetical protein
MDFNARKLAIIDQTMTDLCQKEAQLKMKKRPTEADIQELASLQKG